MDRASATDELLLTLQLQCRLTRTRPHTGWTAELNVPGMSGHLMFPSLPELIGWIARLDSSTGPRASSPSASPPAPGPRTPAAADTAATAVAPLFHHHPGETS